MVRMNSISSSSATALGVLHFYCFMAASSFHLHRWEEAASGVCFEFKPERVRLS